MTGGYEIGFSGSASSGNELTAQFGGGDVSVSTGGEKQSMTFAIVAGVVAVAAVLIVLLFLRR